MEITEDKRRQSLSSRPPKTSDKILQLLRQNQSLSAGDIAQLVGISRKGVEKHFARLKRYGMLRRVGPDRGGHWEVL